MNEFEIIEHFFNQQDISRNDVILSIGDDCAIVDVPANHDLLITTDTLVENVHFPAATSPYDIGYKALAVNLSDLAAMGATPAWITLALTMPEANKDWLKDFCKGLFDLAKKHNVQLIGGDLTRGPLTITVQAQGFTPENQAIRRDGAKPGDLIYVTNALGNAALALKMLQTNHKVNERLLCKLNRPEPRVEIGEKLRGIASAAIDISDGLAADLKHILERSKTGAIVNVDKIPLSKELQETVSISEAISLALNGGDDYELCFTVPEEKNQLLNNAFFCIGTITEDRDLKFIDNNNKTYSINSSGYKHF